jgi:hypothetical protein
VRRAFGIARILVAVTGVVALIGDINYTIGTGGFAIVNFFSYFTVQSMILAVVVLGLAAANALRATDDPLWLDTARLISTTYVLVSGIVFGFILIAGAKRGIPVWAPWSSLLLHFWIPAFALLDWLIAPGRNVPWRTIRWVLVFPVAWVIYTMIRGASVYWYPYFFLDPAVVEIPLPFGFYLLAIVVIFTGTMALLIGISRLPTLEHLRRRWGRRR